MCHLIPNVHNFKDHMKLQTILNVDIVIFVGGNRSKGG